MTQMTGVFAAACEEAPAHVFRNPAVLEFSAHFHVLFPSSDNLWSLTEPKTLYF